MSSDARPGQDLALHRESLQRTPEGEAFSARYGDVYASRAGAAGQAREVFLQGCALAGAQPCWQGRRQFTVLETGFGLGSNFLATWQAWRDDPRRPQVLHYVALELHPLHARDLVQECADPRWRALAAEVAAQWPPAMPGLHPIWLDGGQVRLLLALGDAPSLLPQLQLGADAVYLDGFAPARNPRMWNPELLQAVTEVCRGGARLASYSVARQVCDGLRAAGWEVHKMPGYAAKAQRLQALLPMPARPGRARAAALRAESALVIGAGLAGAAAAQSLAARGWQVRVLDPQGVAGATSALPAGLAHLRPAAADDRLARLSRSALGWLRLASPLPSAALQCGDGVLMAAAEPRLGRLPTQAQAWDAQWLRELTPAQAAAHAGVAQAPAAWWTGGSVFAADALRRRWLARDGIELCPPARVESLRRGTDGCWEACDARAQVLARARVCVLACAGDGPRLLHASGLDCSARAQLQLQQGQGFVVPAALLPALGDLRTGVMAGAYALPLPMAAVEACGLDPAQRWLFVGATHEHAHQPPLSPQQAWERVGAGLRPWCADANAAARWPQQPPPQARVFRGTRAMGPGRLPLVGCWPEGGDDLHVSLGMGSRGLLLSALAAQCITSAIEGDPAPLEADLLQALDPLRAEPQPPLLRPRPAPEPANRAPARRDGGP